MPSTHIILLHAAAAGIYLRDFDRISPSVYGGRRSRRKRMLTLLTSIVIIRKKPIKMKRKSPIPARFLRPTLGHGT